MPDEAQPRTERLRVDEGFGFITPFDDADRAFAKTVVDVLRPTIDSIARSFPMNTEVLLQDITAIPYSIAAIANPITGRSIGGPPTNAVLHALRHGLTEDHIAYRSEAPDGTPLRSSAVYFRGPSGRQVVCLCINSAIDELERVADTIMRMALKDPPEASTAVTPSGDSTETYPPNLESLSEGLLLEEIAATGVRVDLMRKSHRMDVVRGLDSRGFFALRGAVELLAERLGVSRYSVYNYLEELKVTMGSEREDSTS